MAKPKRFCYAIEDGKMCNKPAYGHGLCSKHYHRWKRYGRLYNLPKQPTKPVEKLPLPSNLMREQWLIYAAGFFDGEGCVVITINNTQHLYLKINAVQKVIEPLKILQGLFGGCINERRTAPAMWSASCQKAYHALQEMLPYLIVKRSQAKLGIEFQKRIGRAISGALTDEEKQIRQSMREEMQRLNHL